MKYLVSLFILFPVLLIGQNADTLKFKVIEASVNFLATDKTAFPKSAGKKSDCPTSDYECLKKFCTDNKLDGVNAKMADWVKAEFKSKEEFRMFAATIINDLTGLRGKTYRQRLPDYEKYRDSINRLSSSFKEVPASPAGVVVPVKTNPIVVPLTPPKQVDKNGVPIELIISIIALLFSLLSIILLRRKPAPQKDPAAVFDLNTMNADIKDIQAKIGQKPDPELSRQWEAKWQNIERRISDLERKSEISQSAGTIKPVTMVTNTQATASQLVFAKKPDLSNGFSQSNLMTYQNGEQIYEIEVRGDKAEFSISTDVSVQKYALSDWNFYFADACELMNQPVADSKIITRSKGTLSKSSSNWIIQNKAKIEFK